MVSTINDILIGVTGDSVLRGKLRNFFRTLPVVPKKVELVDLKKSYLYDLGELKDSLKKKRVKIRSKDAKFRINLIIDYLEKITELKETNVKK